MAAYIDEMNISTTPWRKKRDDHEQQLRHCPLVLPRYAKNTDRVNIIKVDAHIGEVPALAGHRHGHD
jgi:hypothetical protein